jgi:hypothetical protein
VQENAGSVALPSAPNANPPDTQFVASGSLAAQDNLSLRWTPQIRAWAEQHNMNLVPTPTSPSHLNGIECHFRPLREFVLNASDCSSYAEVAVALRRQVGAAAFIRSTGYQRRARRAE